MKNQDISAANSQLETSDLITVNAMEKTNTKTTQEIERLQLDIEK